MQGVSEARRRRLEETTEASISRKGIFPAQSGEAGEISVRGEQNQSMFDGQCGKVGIGNQIGPASLVF